MYDFTLIVFNFLLSKNCLYYKDKEFRSFSTTKVQIIKVISFQLFYLTFFNLLSLIKITWKWEHGLAFILNSVALLHTYTQIGSCFIFIIMPCLLVILLIGTKRIGIPRNIRYFFYTIITPSLHIFFEVINGELLATWINF